MTDFDPTAQQVALAPVAPQPSVPQVIDQNVSITGFHDPTVRQYDFELYSGRLNVTDRIYLLQPYQIIKARRHYHEKTKFILCNSEYTRSGDQELMTREGECCKKLGNNNLVFAALVLRYMTEKNGNLIRPFQMPEFRLWRFGVDKYIQLRNIDAEHKLDAHDLLVACTDEKYQRMTIGATKESIFGMPGFPPDIKQQAEAWAKSSLPKIPREMGRKMPDAEILKELGIAGAAPTSTTVGDAPITDFSSLVGGAATPPAAGATK